MHPATPLASKYRYGPGDPRRLTSTLTDMAARGSSADLSRSREPVKLPSSVNAGPKERLREAAASIPTPLPWVPAPGAIVLGALCRDHPWRSEPARVSGAHTSAKTNTNHRANLVTTPRGGSPP